jgi:hypothetical protein
MLRGFFSVVIAVLAVAGCTGGGRVGDACGGNDDCADALQCLNRSCVPRCDRAPECGDGFSCDARRLCEPAPFGPGHGCESEVDCMAGLTCQTSGALDNMGKLVASCNTEVKGRPPGAECSDDTDCHVGNCALGHCVQLCRFLKDCAETTSCMRIPHPVTTSATFGGCLPSEGALTWTIPMNSPSEEILLPFPDKARSAELVMTIDDPNQKVGAVSVLAPNTDRIYHLPCSPQVPSDPPCDADRSLDEYYKNAVRHRPAFGQSVLLIPSGSAAPAGPGVYRVKVSSFRANDLPGSAIPQVTAVVQLTPERTMKLDLHFFFLGLADHPCAAMMDGQTLDAATAKDAPYFQDQYVGELRTILFKAGNDGGIGIDQRTYEDIPDHPELDGLDVAEAGDLFRLGKYATGINIFFVRSLSPIGLQAYGPNPGPAGLAGTRQSGIVVALDTLCYRDWQVLARITAHEIARYMGLYHNVELEVAQHPAWRDLINDNDNNDPRDNLMFFSELGRALLTSDQRKLLMRSAVLR